MGQKHPSGDKAQAAAIPKLYVIVPHFNPAGYARREALLDGTVRHLVKAKKAAEKRGAVQLEVCVSSLTYDMTGGDGPSGVDAVRDDRGVLCFSRRSSSVVWSKENLINMALEHVTQWDDEAGFIAWVDGDVTFSRVDWPEAAVAELKRFPSRLAFVQLFDSAKLLGPDGSVLYTASSFAAQHGAGKAYAQVPHGHEEYWHPGFAWAATREALLALRASCGAALPERTLGSADLHVALGLLGLAELSVPRWLTQHLPGYCKSVSRYEGQLKHGFGLGCVSGSLIHGWHGPVACRRHNERWNILARHAFDPERHLVRRHDGLLVWSANAPDSLKQDVTEYFSQRNEDTMQLETLCEDVHFT